MVDETKVDPFVVGAVVYLISDLKRETPMTVMYVTPTNVDVTWLDVNKHAQFMSGSRAVFEEYGERERRRRELEREFKTGDRMPRDPRGKNWDY